MSNYRSINFNFFFDFGQSIVISFKFIVNVKTFFVGGAIEISMAEEIFNQVKNGELTTAANLTNENQLSEICSWIINI